MGIVGFSEIERFNLNSGSIVFGLWPALRKGSRARQFHFSAGDGGRTQEVIDESCIRYIDI